jgi:hypothetical protein
MIARSCGVPREGRFSRRYYDKCVRGILYGKRERSQKSVRVLFLSVRDSELLQKAWALQTKQFEGHGERLREDDSKDDPIPLFHILYGLRRLL